MSALYIVASSLFLLWEIRNILFWIALWQLKEYRLDRLTAHLKETKQGYNLLFSPILIVKLISIALYSIIIFNSSLLYSYQIAVSIIFFYLSVSVVYEILSHVLKRPVITLKSLIIFIAVSISLVALYNIPLIDKFLWLLLLDRLTPFLVAFFVFILSFPTELIHDYIIGKAIKKIKKHKKILVVAITGSYGKSSTKDYIAQILSRKFNVLKTRGTNNTPIGIANTILKGLRPNTEILVVEMGAYKRGEITQMCQMVHPNIGVLTAVNDQHLSLFGKIENTMRAKYELIESLPKDGIALFNGNNDLALSLYRRTEDKMKILYKVIGTKENIEGENSEVDVLAYNVVAKKESVIFDARVGKKIFQLNAPVLGSHNVENILPGIYIARKLGMKDEDIKEAVLSLAALPQTMVRYITNSGVTLIDDTFNANPQSIRAAFQYMKIYKQKRIFVLQPMIELGKHAKRDHYELGKEIASICDYLILTNKNFHSEIVKGIRDGGGKCRLIIMDTNTINFIAKIIDRGDIILFASKESKIILNKLL